MLFPWIGMFEQIRLADIFVYYDDVQFSKGSFTNRVQLKSITGSEWMSIPLKHIHLGQNINETFASNNNNWRNEHAIQLKKYYEDTPFYADIKILLEEAYSHGDNLSAISKSSMACILDYFGLANQTYCINSSELNIEGSGSRRVLDIVKHFNADTYITGHGARNYFDHNLFDINRINVQYMNYNLHPYPQKFGAFTPYVSILDLIANTGRDGVKYIQSGTIHWKEFINE